MVTSDGLWLSVGGAFVGGLLLNLTPCVYPMVPVTLAYFSTQAAGSLRHSAALAGCYVLGLALHYALLGMLAATTGVLFGSWLQQPAVLVGIALAILALSFSMFGAYELRVPQAVAQRLGRAFAGLRGAFIMGLVVGLVAAPCIGPFILSLLVYVGQQANAARGFVLFFALGLGMGLPYLLLGVGAARLGLLPKAGSWLVWSKKALGLVLIGLAIYVMRPLLSSRMVSMLVMALLLGSGLYLGWLERTRPQGRRFAWVRRVVGTVLVLAAVTVMWPRSQASAAVAWIPYSEARLLQAQREGQPAIVDVYADWCLPCVEMDHVTFRHPDVVQALSRVVTLRVDATREVSSEAEALLDRYHVYGAPTMLLFDRSGVEREALRVTGFARPQEFLKRLKQIL